MKNNDSLRRWCAQPQEDDGVDPRRYFAKNQKRSNDRKARQLCRQAYRALSLIFPHELPEPDLQKLIILGVVPGPDASRLCVQVGSPASLAVPERDRSLIALERVKGRLRHEIAGAITRRRAPDLSFEWIGQTGGDS